MRSDANATHREPSNKRKIVGQKAPFKPKDRWALRARLEMESRVGELALFNLGIDSKLRGCDLIARFDLVAFVVAATSQRNQVVRACMQAAQMTQ